MTRSVSFSWRRRIIVICIVNAVSYEDLAVFFCHCFLSRRGAGQEVYDPFLCFSCEGSGLHQRPSALNGGPILEYRQVPADSSLPVPVRKKQHSSLPPCQSFPMVKQIVLNQHLVLNPPAFADEVRRVTEEVNHCIHEGQTVVVMTRRERIDAGTGNPEDDLRIAVTISDAITPIVCNLREVPSFLIAEGGITSSDIGTRGLQVKKALAMGQSLPGIPVWKTGPESRFPGLSYVIFPGNVGPGECSRRSSSEKLSQKG